MSDVAVLEPTRLPIPVDVAKKYELSHTQWRVLTDQIFPAARTVEAVVMALEYCRSRKLDIMKRPVHIVPIWSSAKGKMVETVWPGIAEIRTTAARTGQYVGDEAIQYGEMITRKFTGRVEQWENKQKTSRDVTKEVTFPEWASVVIYRLIGGQPRPFHTKLWWLETYGTLRGTDLPNDMWTKRPIAQFDKCLEAAALRRAFPEEIGNDLVAEEMEGRTIDHDAEDQPTKAPEPPKPPVQNNKKSALGAEPPVSSVQKMPPTPPKPPVKAPKVEPEPEFERAEHVEQTFDGETVETVEEPPQAGDLLSALDNDLDGASTEEEIEAIWDAHDLLARLESMQGGEQFQGVALGIKRRHLKRVQG